MSGATGKLSGPVTQTGFDVSKGSMPIDSGGSGRGLPVVDSLLITQCGQSFDVTVVADPASRDHVMVEMLEPLHQLFDPPTQRIPLTGQFGRRQVGPTKRTRDLVQLGRPFPVKEAGQRRNSRRIPDRSGLPAVLVSETI
jgi:hypothetical protein